MTFANPTLRYEAKFNKALKDRCFYQVKEWNAQKLLRTFTGVISKTQRATAKGFKDRSVEDSIVKWCEHYPNRLPKDGGTVDVNLNEEQIS